MINLTKNLISIINNEIHKMKTLNENYNLLHENITCFFFKKNSTQDFRLKWKQQTKTLDHTSYIKLIKPKNTFLQKFTFMMTIINSAE